MKHVQEVSHLGISSCHCVGHLDSFDGSLVHQIEYLEEDHI